MWGYKDWVKACEEGRWDEVDWNEDPKKSGAKEVETNGMTTVYRF